MKDNKFKKIIKLINKKFLLNTVYYYDIQFKDIDF